MLRNPRSLFIRSALAASLVAAFVASGQVASGQVASAQSLHGGASGWTIEQGMLCYTWPSHRWACTSHWYRNASGQLISLRPDFVPSQSSGGGVSPTSDPVPNPQPPGSCPGAGLPVIGGVANGMHIAPGGVPNDSCLAVQKAPYGGALSLWKAPPAPFDRVYAINPSLYYSAPGTWPTCAWWAHATRPSYRPGDVNHRDPKVGATIRYMPGVLGAGSGGHVGHVVQVYDDGWILTSEMNFYWRGGGAGRVIFRFVPAHTAGVTYVY